MGGQELIDVRIVGEFLEHQAHGDARPPDNRLSAQNLGVGGDAIFLLRWLCFFHGDPIISHRRHSDFPLKSQATLLAAPNYSQDNCVGMVTVRNKAEVQITGCVH
jgi:hypothetical protein